MTKLWSETMAQARSLVENETDRVANAANVCALLKERFGWWWVGVYYVDSTTDTLVLGPFQGPVACTRIPFGRGVCGTCWQRRESIVVPDVELFPGHIACSSLSRSEIVVPVFVPDGSVKAVLDIDSDKLDAFDYDDKSALEEIAKLL